MLPSLPAGSSSVGASSRSKDICARRRRRSFRPVPVMAHWRPLLSGTLSGATGVSPHLSGGAIHSCCCLLGWTALRADDLVRLGLADINWQDAWIRVSGKSRREARLPLSQEVRDAIASYLQHSPAAARTDSLAKSYRPPMAQRCRQKSPLPKLAIGSWNRQRPSAAVDAADRRAGDGVPAA